MLHHALHLRSKLCTAMADAATKIIVRLCFHRQHKAQTYHDKCPCGKALRLQDCLHCLYSRSQICLVTCLHKYLHSCLHICLHDCLYSCLYSCLEQARLARQDLRATHLAPVLTRVCTYSCIHHVDSYSRLVDVFRYLMKPLYMSDALATPRSGEQKFCVRAKLLTWRL